MRGVRRWAEEGGDPLKTPGSQPGQLGGRGRTQVMGEARDGIPEQGSLLGPAGTRLSFPRPWVSAGPPEWGIQSLCH